MNIVIIQSIITCLHCGHQKEEIMPTNACQYYYECEHCKTILKPKAGDCNVFCSYVNVPCPSVQQEKDCYKTN
jgi:hypothetical protein